jgi:allophanate hydrolase subunit 2
MREKAMTLGQRLIARGRREGKLDIARNMVKAAMSENTIIALTGLTSKAIQQLKKEFQSFSKTTA